MAFAGHEQQPKTVSLAIYPSVSYAHQAWLSDDHRYAFLNDEGDEAAMDVRRTRTIVFDLRDLEDPVVAAEYFATTSATDHNLYVRGRYLYQANYDAGLRILDIAEPAKPKEVAYFDTTPAGMYRLGAWTNYPYFASGIVVVTSYAEGVFVLRPRLR